MSDEPANDSALHRYLKFLREAKDEDEVLRATEAIEHITYSKESQRVTHEQLWETCRKLLQDYQPYGNTDRESGPDGWGQDCSSGCRFYIPLPGNLGFDWGVCVNSRSHRVGLLTFEHQGCFEFEGAGNGPS